MEKLVNAQRAAATRRSSVPTTPEAELESPPSSASATDKVTEAITRGIRCGDFAPGQHLLEPDLTRRLGISRGSLREAFKHLAAAGVVTLSRFRGAYIDTLDRKSVLDLLDTLEPLARLAGRLAATQCDTDEKRARMATVADAIEKAAKVRHGPSYLEHRRRFYDAMIEIAGNLELARVIPLPRTDLFRAQIERVQSEQQRSRHASGYGKIARAIINRDASAADQALKRHFEGTRKTVDELPASAFPSWHGG